jgi:hypothetical protein
MLERVFNRNKRSGRQSDAWLTSSEQNRLVDDRTRTEDEIKKAEQHEAFKQTLLRLLDDPQVQQKIVSLLLHRFGKDLRDKGLSGRST